MLTWQGNHWIFVPNLGAADSLEQSSTATLGQEHSTLGKFVWGPFRATGRGTNCRPSHCFILHQGWKERIIWYCTPSTNLKNPSPAVGASVISLYWTCSFCYGHAIFWYRIWPKSRAGIRVAPCISKPPTVCSFCVAQSMTCIHKNI